jgi:hypothetical protein
VNVNYISCYRYFFFDLADQLNVNAFFWVTRSV